MNKQMRLFLCLAVLFLGGNAGAQGLGLQGKQKPAYLFLKCATSFDTGGAPWHKGEEALYYLLKGRQAQRCFLSLLADPQIPLAGKLYALTGLRRVDRAAFDKKIGSFLADSTPVHTATGCVPNTEQASVVAKRIQQGRIQINPPVNGGGLHF